MRDPGQSFRRMRRQFLSGGRKQDPRHDGRGLPSMPQLYPGYFALQRNAWRGRRSALLFRAFRILPLRAGRGAGADDPRTDRIISLGGQAASPEIKELFPPSYKNLILRYLNHTCEYSAPQATALIFEKFDKNKLTDNPGMLFRFALEFIDSLYAALAGAVCLLPGCSRRKRQSKK